MLKFVKIEDQSEKRNFLLDFNPKDSAFIVSDIKSKLFLESELLKKYNYLEGSCVLRANEFYKECFCSLDSKWNIVSDSLLKELFFDFCNNQPEAWIKNLQNSKSFFEFFNNFLIIFLHEENLASFKEWLAVYKGNLFWKRWLKLSQKFFEFLKSKQILNDSAVKSLLLHQLSSENKNLFNKNKILVDLSFSLDLCEKEIFTELARHKELYILSPLLKYRELFENKFDIYEKWESEQDKEKIIKYSFQNLKMPDTRAIFKVKTETQIQEIKQTVAQVYKWIQQGVAPNDIAIYAPNIEDYWFALKGYFEKENIPFRKTVYSKLIDFKEIKYLLSAMRIHLSLFNFEDLELFYFYKESKKNFQRFKENYFHEPKRDLVRKFLFQDKIKDCNQKVTGFDFIEWLLSFWSKIENEELSDSLKAILKKMTLNETLAFSSWLKYFEKEVFSKEVEISAEQSEGVSCLSFNAFYSVKSSYVFILGLTEEALKANSLLFLNETEDLLQDLGFPVAINFSRQRERSLLWFLQSSHYKELYLSCYSYDLNGDFHTMSLLYMLSDKLFYAKNTDISEALVWDLRRKQKKLEKILSDKPKDQVQALSFAFKNKAQSFFPLKKMHLSANSIKTYTDCPFKYAGEKIFFVSREQSIEREASPLLKGKLVHSLFEKALTEHPQLDITEEQINQLIDKLPINAEKLIHKKQLTLIKEYLKRILQEFLIKEKEQRKKFPQLKPLALEAEVRGFWDQKEGSLSKEGDYVFKAYLDRVDQDQNTKKYVLRDYKASSTGLTNISSWLKNEELQLIFYAQALEKGLVEKSSEQKKIVKKLPAGEISAVFFSIYGDQFKTKGFEEKASSVSGLMGEGRAHQKEKALLAETIKSNNRFTQKKVKQMEEGKFLPNPKDFKECKKCPYQNWCRVEDK